MLRIHYYSCGICVKHILAANAVVSGQRRAESWQLDSLFCSVSANSFLLICDIGVIGGLSLVGVHWWTFISAYSRFFIRVYSRLSESEFYTQA